MYYMLLRMIIILLCNDKMRIQIIVQKAER